jgi:hypothetical protein
MIRSGAFWLGVGVGAVAAWVVARRRDQLITAAPHGVRPLSRRGRRGQNWPGQQDAYAN